MDNNMDDKIDSRVPEVHSYMKEEIEQGFKWIPSPAEKRPQITLGELKEYIRSVFYKSDKPIRAMWTENGEIKTNYDTHE